MALTETPFKLSFSALKDPKKVWVGTPGSREEGLGKLALLTPDVVRQASSELQIGRRVTLGWSLTKLEVAGFGRKAISHKIIPVAAGIAYDDIYEMNSQQSSQWDGLRLFSQSVDHEDGSTSRVFYGGTSSSEIMDRSNDRIGMQHWAKEGIAGRGVLLDYASWAERNDIQYSTFSTYQIPLAHLLEIAKESGIVFRSGDILLIRIGVIKEWDSIMTNAQKYAYANSKNPEHAGVEATLKVLELLWNNQFSVIGGDALSWEYVLAGWGMPIGELFDLEELSCICKELGRWTFFLTATPFNMPGGVSSPPNAMALF